MSTTTKPIILYYNLLPCFNEDTVRFFHSKFGEVDPTKTIVVVPPKGKPLLCDKEINDPVIEIAGGIYYTEVLALLAGDTPARVKSAREVAQAKASEQVDTGTFKDDSSKIDPSILLGDCNLGIQGVLEVLQFGIVKYKERASWKKVPKAVARYQAAMLRHALALSGGELVDPESGKLHVDHIATNALFISQLLKENNLV